MDTRENVFVELRSVTTVALAIREVTGVLDNGLSEAAILPFLSVNESIELMLTYRAIR